MTTSSTPPPADPAAAAGPAATGPAGTVIAVAPTGSRSRVEVPHLPVTAQEVAGAAADCERVGAAVIDLEPRRDSALAEVVEAVRARTDLLVRVTTRARSETLEQILDVGADVLVCPLDSPDDFVLDLLERAAARGTPVHFEVRTPAELEALTKWSGDAPAHGVLVFGTDALACDVQGFAAAWGGLPAGATCTAVGLDAANVPVMLASLAAGGCVRTGMADTLLYSDDVEVRDNAQLVARAAGVAKIAQRPPLPPSRAARVLGIRSPA